MQFLNFYTDHTENILSRVDFVLGEFVELRSTPKLTFVTLVLDPFLASYLYPTLVVLQSIRTMSSIPTILYRAAFVFVIDAVSATGSSVVTNLPDLEVLEGDLPLYVSLEVDDFFDGSDYLVLLLLVFLPWFAWNRSGIIVTDEASVVIGGVGIGAIVCSSTCDMEETVEGGRRVVAGATEGVSSIEYSLSCYDPHSSIKSDFALDVTFSSSRIPGSVPVPSLEVIGVTVDSLRTLGDAPVPSLEPLACSESNSSDTSTADSGVSEVFFHCNPLPMLFLGGIKPLGKGLVLRKEVIDNDFGEPGAKFSKVDAFGPHTCWDACKWTFVTKIYKEDFKDFTRYSECLVEGRVLDDIDDNLKSFLLL
nr:hypothetical protein [Tanacetum cinerariifolium]